MKIRFSVLIWLGLIAAFSWQNVRADPPILPVDVDANSFAMLLEESPFLRHVGGTNSLILTGVAVIDNKTVATLLDSDTQLTHLITEGQANKDGWQLVAFKGDRDNPETMLVQVQRATGDVVPVRFEKAPDRPLSRKSTTKTKLSEKQLAEIKAAAKNPGRGLRGDGLSNSDMTPEFKAKLERLSETQRVNLNRQIMDLRNQGLSNEKRAEIYRNEVDKALKIRR